MIVLEESDLIDFFKAAGIKFSESSNDFEIYIDDGNDSVFLLEFKRVM